MTRYQFPDAGEPASLASTVMTRLFDLLLVGGYVACIILTYLLIARPGASTTVAAATPVAVTNTAATPAATQTAATTTPTPETTPTTSVTEGQDLIAAMKAYLLAINSGDYSKAVAMRADPDVPQIEKLKKIKSIKASALVPYPRIARDRGSLYVELTIEKADATTKWKGRIDWEKRGNKWVMVKWDSKAQKPGAADAEATPGPEASPTPKPAASPTPKPTASPTPKPAAVPAAQASPTPKPPDDSYDFSFSGSQ